MTVKQAYQRLLDYFPLFVRPAEQARNLKNRDIVFRTYKPIINEETL